MSNPFIANTPTFIVNCVAYNPKTDKFENNSIIEIFNKDALSIRDTFGRELAKTMTGNANVECRRDALAAIAKDGRPVVMDWYDTRNLIRDYFIEPGDTIYYLSKQHYLNNLCNNVTTQFTKALAKIVSIMEIKYNTVLKHHTSNIIYDGCTTVDINTPLAIFRKTLSDLHHIAVTECIVRKHFGGIQLKDDDKTLQQHGINAIGHVYIEKGIPLKVNQNMIRIFVQNELKDRCLVCGFVRGIFGDENNINMVPESILNICFELLYEEANLPLIYIGDVVLEDEWSMYRVKKEISATFYGQVPLIRYMRIRESVNQRLTHVYYDDKTFGHNAGGSLQDYKEIVCQRCMRQEVITKKHILIHVVFFDGTQCGKMYDIAFLKKCLIQSEFKKELSEISGIPRDRIQVRKVYPHVYKEQITRWNCQAFKKDFNNEHEFTKKSTLCGEKWSLRSGDIVVYKTK